MNAPAYDPANLFAKIIAGDIPSYKIYEDDKVFAFLDIMPRSEGHVLVLCKTHARNVLDCPTDDLGAVMKAVQKIARAAQKAFSADGVSIRINNEAAGDQEIFHLHVHVIPRFNGVDLNPPGIKADAAHLLGQAESLKAAL